MADAGCLPDEGTAPDGKNLSRASDAFSEMRKTFASNSPSDARSVLVGVGVMRTMRLRRKP